MTLGDSGWQRQVSASGSRCTFQPDVWITGARTEGTATRARFTHSMSRPSNKPTAGSSVPQIALTTANSVRLQWQVYSPGPASDASNNTTETCVGRSNIFSSGMYSKPQKLRQKNGKSCRMEMIGRRRTGRSSQSMECSNDRTIHHSVSRSHRRGLMVNQRTSRIFSSGM